MEPTKQKRWQLLKYTQAHECMHLFGADDLYYIRDARKFAATDIINYPSKVLNASTLEQITDNAVLLTHNPPQTPFVVRTLVR